MKLKLLTVGLLCLALVAGFGCDKAAPRTPQGQMRSTWDTYTSTVNTLYEMDWPITKVYLGDEQLSPEGGKETPEKERALKEQAMILDGLLTDNYRDYLTARLNYDLMYQYGPPPEGKNYVEPKDVAMWTLAYLAGFKTQIETLSFEVTPVDSTTATAVAKTQDTVMGMPEEGAKTVLFLLVDDQWKIGGIE